MDKIMKERDILIEDFYHQYENFFESDFDQELFDDYRNCNIFNKCFYDYIVNEEYKEFCDCSEDIDCEHVHHHDDEFMYDKIPMFPKNMLFQKYYDKIFPKRLFKNKIYYYLPNDSKYISTQYTDKNNAGKFNIYRIIEYFYVNSELVLIRDEIHTFFGCIHKHYHPPDSQNFQIYIKKLENHEYSDINETIIKI
jgi:hypothetical protein